MDIDDAFRRVLSEYLAMKGNKVANISEGFSKKWGMDFDNMLGWHLHPFGAADGHESISEKNIEEIVTALSDVLDRVIRVKKLHNVTTFPITAICYSTIKERSRLSRGLFN